MTKLKNIAIAIASMVIFTNITHAQVVKASYSVNYEEPLDVKYIGKDGNYLTFQVSVQSLTPGNSFLSIADKNEGVIYSLFFTPEFAVHTVKIERKDDQVLNFKLTMGKDTYSKSFSVNTNKTATTTPAENVIIRL